MKKIGFVDYYISEWHANNYPKWMAEANEKLGLDYGLCYAWAELDKSPVTGETTDEWCARMSAERCGTIEELCEKSDVIVILAPSDPDKHLGYASKVLPYGKRTYIDKTFAPNHEIASEIFRIAEESHTPFFSSSALRYAAELKEFSDVKNLILSGGGSNLNEYVIHLVEMAVSLLKNPVTDIRIDRLGKQRICHLETENGAKAALVYSPFLPYSATYENSKGESVHQKLASAFFNNLIEDMLRFFEEGTTSFDVRETLEVMRVRDMILKADQE